MKSIVQLLKMPLPDGLSDKIEQLLEQNIQLKHQLDQIESAQGAGFDIGKLKSKAARDENVRQIRSRSRATYLGDDTMLCRVLGRYKMYVAASDVGFGAHLMLDGYWEFGTTEFIARCVEPGMTVLDLGANFGYYTLLMADVVGPSGRVHAFEPNPRANTLLSQSVSINGFASRVTIDDRALWDVSGETLTFRIPDGEPKNARVTGGEEWESGFSQIQVGTVSLDDLDLGEVDFIKADIEGAEERLWAGMQKLLRKSPGIVFLLEFSCARCSDPRRTLEEMQQVFPLQYLDHDSAVHPVSIDQLLARQEDWMLVLTSRPAASLL